MLEKDQSQQKLILFLAISLFIHIFALLISPYLPLLSAPRLAQDDTIVVDLDPNLLAQLQKNSPKQVAESEAADNKSEPKDAAFLGERSQSVEQQTRAKNAETFRTTRGQARQAGKAGQQSLSLKNLAAANNIQPMRPEEVDGQRELAQQKQAQANAGNNGGELAPSTSDYLKDVKEGDRTMLNTKEFVYFSYFRRIRQQLEVAWNRQLRGVIEGYFVSGRQLASAQNYITRVVVILDRHGTITNVQVRSASGLRDLDQVAIDAFNQAGPFPDPPSGIVDTDGYIRIPWDFIVQSG